MRTVPQFFGAPLFFFLSYTRWNNQLSSDFTTFIPGICIIFFSGFFVDIGKHCVGTSLCNRIFLRCMRAFFRSFLHRFYYREFFREDPETVKKYDMPREFHTDCALVRYFVLIKEFLKVPASDRRWVSTLIKRVFIYGEKYGNKNFLFHSERTDMKSIYLNSIYSKNYYKYSKNYKIMSIFTINCSNFSENTSKFHYVYF